MDRMWWAKHCDIICKSVNDIRSMGENYIWYFDGGYGYLEILGGDGELYEYSCSTDAELAEMLDLFI